MNNLVLFLVFASAAAHSSRSFTYLSEEGNTYDFSKVCKFKHVKDSNGGEWKVDICPTDENEAAVTSYEQSEVDAEISPFKASTDKVEISNNDDDDDAEEIKKWVSTIRGLSNLTEWSENEDGVEVFIDSLTNCPLGGTYQTAIEFVCVPYQHFPTYTVDNEGCFATIYVNSSYGCPIDPNASSKGDNRVFLHINLFVMVLPLLFVVLCCCAICAKKRRNQRFSTISKNLSNVAFQPIPTTQTLPTTINSQSPIYNPFIQPAQYYYYVPCEEESALGLPQTTQ